eukprot:3669756-Pyramimonas_sp.AAC.1
MEAPKADCIPKLTSLFSTQRTEQGRAIAKTMCHPNAMWQSAPEELSTKPLRARCLGKGRFATSRSVTMDACCVRKYWAYSQS